jgi:hypothetical protein
MRQNDVLASLDELFQIYDFIRHIDFTGGEILLWDGTTCSTGTGDLAEIIRYCERFKAQMSFGRILMNCTLIPSDAVCEAIVCCGYDFDFLLDNYGAYSRTIEETKRKLDDYGIRYREYKYFGSGQEFSGWIDIHNSVEYRERTAAELSDVWINCNLANKSSARNMFNGYLYPCCAALVMHNTAEMNFEGGFISLLDRSVPVDKKRLIVESWTKSPIKYCEYCNGFAHSPEMQQRVPAAEQE